VTVEMHWVRLATVVLENDLDGLVGTKVVNVPDEGEIDRAVLGFEENWVVQVDSHGTIVLIPEKMCAVGLELNDNSLYHLGLSWRQLHSRNGFRQRVVTTVLVVPARLGGRVWSDISAQTAILGLVVYNGLSVVVRRTIGDPTVGRRESAEIECIARVAGSLDENICSLTNTESDDIGLVGLNRNEIVGNDSELVTVQADLDSGSSTWVDEPQSVCLSSSEVEACKASIWDTRHGSVLARVAVLSVDENVVESRHAGVRDWCKGLCDERLVVLVVPVADHDRTDVDIVVVVLRTVDDHWTSYTTAILRAVMRVPPRGAIKTCSPGVSKILSRCDRALRDTGDTIISLRVLLQDSVPMDRKTFIFDSIVDVDLYHVTPVGFQERSRILAVDQEASHLNAIWCELSFSDSPVVRPRLASVWDL